MWGWRAVPCGAAFGDAEKENAGWLKRRGLSVVYAVVCAFYFYAYSSTLTKCHQPGEHVPVNTVSLPQANVLRKQRSTRPRPSEPAEPARTHSQPPAYEALDIHNWLTTTSDAPEVTADDAITEKLCVHCLWRWTRDAETGKTRDRCNASEDQSCLFCQLNGKACILVRSILLTHTMPIAYACGLGAQPPHKGPFPR